MQCSSHKVDNVVIFVLFRSKGKLISAQVCIPVGCVPPAFWPYLPAYTVQAVVSAPGGGCLLLGVGGLLSQHALRQTPM